MAAPEEYAQAPAGTRPGFFVSLRRTGQLILQTVHTRIELLSLELREEAVRAVKAVILVSAFIFLAAVALILVTFTIIFSVWDDPHQRLAALWWLSGFYVLGAAVAGTVAWRMLNSDRLPFADTLREFEKDREWIRSTTKPE